jgi:hypothetical protein
MSRNDIQEIPENFFANVLAGTTIAFTCFPLEGLKKWWQSKQDGHTLSSWKNYRLLRGSTVFAINIIPTTVVQLTTKSSLKYYLREESSLIEKIFGSALCGISGAICATFVENVIIRQQILKSGPMHALVEMLNISIFRPWKSFRLIATRDGIFTVSMFCILPELEKKIKKLFPDNYLTVILARFAIGFLGTVLSHPWDTLATRMQMTHERMSLKMAYKDALTNLTVNNKKRPLMCLYTGFIFRLALFNIFQVAIPYVKDKTTEYLS